MGAHAFIFPGQGSQYVGMAKELFRAHESARAIMERADRVLGMPLSTLCFEGPEQELRQTRNTQPAIFVHSIAVLQAMHRQSPDMVAGHSLGEYSALVAANALAFNDALRLVRLRGELMQHAGESQRGTMAAVVGLPPDEVESACRLAGSEGVVQPANFNSPGQIVISGSVAGVHRAMEIAKERGAQLVKELVVSGAFHAPLMEPAREGLKRALDDVELRDAELPVYANVTAEPVTRAEEIRDMLCRQLTSPVRWEQTVHNMVRDGADEFTEVGPGKVLQGLVRRIEPAAKVGGFDTWTDLLAQQAVDGPGR
jgi:[acyl-carrier-protein] S-malonyltransferase